MSILPTVSEGICSVGCANECMGTAYQFGFICLVAGWALAKIIPIIAAKLKEKYVRAPE